MLLSYKNIAIFQLSEEDWLQKLSGMTRLWHDDYGYCAIEIVRKSMRIPDYILVRDDGWSMGCYKEEFDKAFKVWEKDWVAIYEQGLLGDILP